MEEWRDISEYEGLYQVSNCGRIRSLDRLVKNHHDMYYLKPGQIKSLRQKSNGYMIVDLYKDNRQKTCHVHRLVAEAFIPNPETKETVNHKDGNIQNNHISNLEWATPHEQNIHFYRNGLKSKANINRAINAMNRAQEKPVKCITTGIRYRSAQAAAKALNKKYSSLICACCRGKRQSAYGLKWEYA